MTGQRHYRAQGNNALQLNEAFIERAPERKISKSKPAEKTIAVPKQAVKEKPKQKQKKGLASTLFVLFGVFALLSFVIARYAMICSTGNDINGIKSKMQEISRLSDELKTDMAVKLDMAYIQQVAKDKLKMGFPAEEQVKYIDLNKENTAAVVDNEGNQVSKGDDKNINVLSEIVNALQ